MDDTSPYLRPRIPPPLRPVPFSAHFAALLADALILLGVVVAAGLVFGLAIEAFPNATAPSMRFLAEFAIVGLLLFTTVSEIVFATSPGKSIYGLTIATASGRRATLRRLSARWALKYAPLLLVLALAVLDRLGNLFGYAPWTRSLLYWPAWVMLTLARLWAWAIVGGFLLTALPSRRTLHDLLAGTAVFDRARLAHHWEPLNRGFEIAPITVVPLPTDAPETLPAALPPVAEPTSDPAR